MRIIAWVDIGLVGLAIILGPLLMGQVRKPYNYADYIAKWVSAGLMIPICGRILGWW